MRMAAIYTRVSSEQQRDEKTIASQGTWFAADSLGRKGEDSEITFLLREMFPYADDPDW